MRRMTLMLAPILALSLGAVTTAAAVRASSPRATITVTPSSGAPSTRFGVRFRNPVVSGRVSGLFVREAVSVIGPRRPSGSACRTTANITLPPAGLNRTVRGTLAPGAPGWCPGSFGGVVTEYRSIACRIPIGKVRRACPEIAFAPLTLGRFRLTVTHAPAS